MATARDYWDTYLEQNPLRAGPADTAAGAFLSHMIESAGDILRELGKEKSDLAYIQEKIKRIERSLHWQRDWTDPLSPGEIERLNLTKERLEGLVTPTPESEVIKNLVSSITNRDILSIEVNLARLQTLLRPPVDELGLRLRGELSKEFREGGSFPAVHPLIIEQFPHPAPTEIDDSKFVVQEPDYIREPTVMPILKDRKRIGSIEIELPEPSEIVVHQIKVDATGTLNKTLLGEIMDAIETFAANHGASKIRILSRVRDKAIYKASGYTFNEANQTFDKVLSTHPLILEQFPHPAPEEMEIGGDIGKLQITIPPPRGSPMPPKKVGITVASEAPHSLTMDDYEKHWKPDGWKLLPIGPTASWRQDWGTWEAIRDIVQNALDETEAYEYGFDDQGLWISDKGKGVSVADFLLGPPKLKPEYARGRFGEGLKIAALALLRLGYPIHIETVGREVWMVFVEQEVNGKAHMLSALWRHNGTRKGTIFHIIGYAGDAYAERFAVNIGVNSILWEGLSTLKVPRQRYNQLLQLPGISHIYARDIYMRDITSPYSYNLWGFDLAPDRHAPKEENDLWVDMGRLWCTVDRVDLLEKFLELIKHPSVLEADESNNVSMDRWKMGELSPGKHYTDLIIDNKEAWLKAWHKVMGENAVLRTSDKWDNIVTHLGYQSVSVNFYVRDALANAIPSDLSIREISQEKLRETEVVPDEKLDSRHMAHLTLARAIARQVFSFSPPSGVYAAIIPPASDRVRTAGMYGTSTQTIYIALDILHSGRDTVDTLVHEMGHHRQWRQTGEAEDLTPSHAAAMTYIASSVIQDIASGAHAALLRNVIW